MDHRRKIIVFFEDLEIRQEAVLFATGLAKRTDANLVFLHLLAFDTASQGDPDGIKTLSGDALTKHLEAIGMDAANSRIVVRTGDPLSEFYKFMSEFPHFDTAIWGGNADVLDTRAGLYAGHWLGQIEQELGCPIVIPKRKAEKESF